jgi:formylglycine-generating enzyme required for sulfatase activity
MLAGVVFIYSSTNDLGKDISVEVRKLVQVTPVPDSNQSSEQVVFQDCADCPEMQLVKGGTFIMGSDTAHPVEQPAHEVQVADFYISKTPITRKQWNHYVRTQKYTSSDLEYQVVSSPASENFPATEIDYIDAKGYAEWLATQYKGSYRLLSEAEWEYAARGGTSTKYFFGNDASQLGEYAWYSENSGETLHPVAQKMPNPLGLYDMYGLIYQWVKDCWHPNYEGAPKTAIPWMSEVCEGRVLRGGDYTHKASEVGSSARWSFGSEQSAAGYMAGIRLARGP